MTHAITSRAGIGPQYAADGRFRARMRLHQSWYRAEVLGVPFGDYRGRGGTRPLGSMLGIDDGHAGKNFLTPEIHAVARRRLADGGGIDDHRLLCNMLSSQPMCFNLFGPLVDDLELATRLARSVWGPAIGRVTTVRIEWAPQPAGEYLADATCFDAFVEYERPGGGLGFLGIETKLCEPFTRQHHDSPSYRRWMTPDSPWRIDASDRVDAIAHNQLWRNHLLTWSMIRHERAIHAAGRCVVVRHPRDARGGIVVAGYRSLLRDPGAVQDLQLDAIVSAWRAELGAGTWLDELHRRYLALEHSDHVVAALAPPSGA